MATMAKSSKAAAALASGGRLLDAAVHVIRSKGYSAARVEDICAEAGLTKGAFFHHFPSKEACAIAAAAHFAANADALFDAAPYTLLPDPRDRMLGYIDFRKAILLGDLPQFTCLLGTMVQEAYDTHPAIRAACDRYINTPSDSRPTSRKRRRSMRPKRTGRRRAPRSSRRPCSRAGSCSPRRSTARKSPQTVLTISSAISRGCSGGARLAPKGNASNDRSEDHALPLVRL
jgi:AcrR family transcriptional regulator